MHRSRPLGVEEGNAIEEIIAFERRFGLGIDTPRDRAAYDKALLVVECGPTFGTVVTRESPKCDVDEEFDEPEFEEADDDTEEEGTFAEAIMIVTKSFAVWILLCIIVVSILATVHGQNR